MSQLVNQCRATRRPPVGCRIEGIKQWPSKKCSRTRHQSCSRRCLTVRFTKYFWCPLHEKAFHSFLHNTAADFHLPVSTTAVMFKPRPYLVAAPPAFYCKTFLLWMANFESPEDLVHSSIALLFINSSPLFVQKWKAFFFPWLWWNHPSCLRGPKIHWYIFFSYYSEDKMYLEKN